MKKQEIAPNKKKSINYYYAWQTWSCKLGFYYLSVLLFLFYERTSDQTLFDVRQCLHVTIVCSFNFYRKNECTSI